MKKPLANPLWKTIQPSCRLVLTPGFGKLKSQPGVYRCKLRPVASKAKPEFADYSVTSFSRRWRKGQCVALVPSRRQSRTAARNAEMKKPSTMFTVEIHPPGRSGKAWIGVECGQVFSIKLMENRTGKDNMTYSAPIEFAPCGIGAQTRKRESSGKKRRRLFTSSEEYPENTATKHPEEFRS